MTDATAKERPIGFYHSGPRLRSSDLEITELFRRFCERPVMVIVDTRSTGGRGETGIPTDAYFAVEEIRDVRLALYLGRRGVKGGLGDAVATAARNHHRRSRESAEWNA